MQWCCTYVIAHNTKHIANTKLKTHLVICMNFVVKPDKQCPSAAVFNYQYYTWNDVMDEKWDLTLESKLVQARRTTVSVL